MAERKPGATPPGETPTFGTMQIPRGGRIEDLAGTDAVKTLHTTVVPSTLAPLPNVAPPPMPADWRYEVTTEIARGGMGRVVEANDAILGRTVALKEALSLDPESVRRFQRETRITARLEHPSIVPVHDAGVTPNGSPFYVMRKISGRPLEELVARAEKLEDRLALIGSIVAAANAVAHAHERGVVHRDIKPSNILVGELGETIVIDWGLAKVMGEPELDRPTAQAAPARARSSTAQPIVEDDDSLKTRAGIVFGTPGFMAPEQLRGAPPDEQSDVYALGATLYHLLARRPPHYSKNPDEMMKSAALGPAAPLRELLPGVPPEVETIVDKALAYRREDRYQDARALAEDLQRFLTGQLVASHHYSRREKLVRFVRKNRALVGVSTAAAVALLVGGSLAVSRVLNERDRADRARELAEAQRKRADEQKDKVTDSLQKLTLAAARTKTESDPTQAVAMVAPLASEARWRQTRAIAAAARAHGVAFGLPASPRVQSLEMSRDGQRVLAAGDDGAVRVYDLGKRTNQVVAQVGDAATARFADGENAIVVAHGDQLAIVEPATGRSRAVTAHAPIAQLATSGPIVYWIDARAELWKLDTSGGAPAQVALDDKARSLATSPDGRWIAVAGDAHLYVLDRTQPAQAAAPLVDGATRAMAWAADAGHFVAVVGDDVIAFEMPSQTIVHRQYVGAKSAVAYVHGQLVATGPMGLAVVQRGDARGRHVDGAFTLGIHEARGGLVVTGGAQGVVAVISPDDEEILHAPGVGITRLESSPASPWLVAAADGELLVWNVDSVAPRRVAEGASGARFVTGDQLVASFGDGPAQWIDLRSDKATPLAPITAGIRTLVPSPDGARALVIDSTRHGQLLAPGAAPVDVDGELEAAAFVDDQRLLVATHGGAIRLDGPAGSKALAQQPGVTAVAARGDRVAAVAPNALWRQTLATGRAEQHPGENLAHALALAATGDVYFGAGKELRVWRMDGTVATLATYDKPLDQLALADRDAVIAVDTEGTIHVAGRPAEVAAPLVAPRASIAEGGLVAAISPDGVLEVIDPLASPGERWPLATPRNRTFGTAQIAPDGSRVLAVTSNGVLVWPLALPATSDATTSWLDGLTNANASPDGTIRWR